MHTFRSSLLSTVIACMSALTLFLSGCEDERVPREYPRVRTLEVTGITEEGALFSAEIYDAGNVEITEHGFTWSFTEPSVSSDERIYLGGFSGTGRFEAEISTALAEGVTYEVCAFVKAGEYTVYGEKIKFISLGSKAPVVTGFSPLSAGWGDTITVTGEKFSHRNITNRIYIDEKACNPFYSSDTLLRFVLPIEVEKTSNSLSVSIMGNIATANEKLLLITPEFYDYSPYEVLWGDTVTFTGHHLGLIGYYPGDGMLLNGLIRSGVACRSPGEVSFVIPGQLEEVSSTVSINYGPFSYTFPRSLTLLPPVADSIRPAEGTWGTTVILYGRFNMVMERNKIMFGDKLARIISVACDSAIVKVPDDLLEYVSKVSYQSAPFPASEFPGSFYLKRPEITGFSPAEGYVGERVTIRGRYFSKNAATVHIGGGQAIVRSANDSVIVCYVPGDAYGECDVTVTQMDYSVTAPGKFNSTNHVITGIDPPLPAFGETVTVRGTNFRPGTLIYIGPYQIMTLSQTENEIKFVVPEWLPYQAGSLIAKYINPNSGYNPESSFTYPGQFPVKDFTVTGVTPVSGEAGDILTISGSDFGTPYITFGSVQGEVLESTSSSITVRVPPLSAGEHTINVTIGDRTHACPVKYTHSSAWMQLADLPFLYDYGCTFDLGEEAYVITGGKTDTYDKEVYRFETSTKGFTRMAGTFRSGILNPISCTLGGKGYMIGQKSTSWTGIGFELFDPDNMTVSKLPDYPGSLNTNPCIIADDSVIYAGCGKIAIPNYFTWYKDFWKYSPATGKWTRLADCPYNVSFSNQVYIDGRLIFLGNSHDTGGTRYLLEYQPLTDTWKETVMDENEFDYWLLLGSRLGARVSVVNGGKWYVGFGDLYQTHEGYGYTNPDINNRFYVFDPVDDSWGTISNVVAPPRTFALAFSTGGKIYIGGHQIYEWYDFWEYDPMLDH
ncbi:MAG: IPT/TIG domain-containing protein [Bacteroidales bacterium]